MKIDKMKLNVQEGLSVEVMPHAAHEFLMTTKEVAVGYGVSAYAIRMAQSRHSAELNEGKHFVKGVTFCHTPANAQPHQVFWTKRGIVRLGFFVKSERARLFRDWAEDLIVKLDAQVDLFGERVDNKLLPGKRRHNRLTAARLVDILSDVCKVEDRELRERIADKLTKN